MITRRKSATAQHGQPPLVINSGIVECRSEYEYAQRPLALIWEGERLEIISIINSQRAPEGKRVRVQTIDENIFDLTYSELDDNWKILKR